MSKQGTRPSSRASSTKNKESANSTKQAADKPSSNQLTKQNQPAGKSLTRQAQRHERRQEEQLRRQQQQRRATRQKGLLIGTLIVAVVIIAAFVAIPLINGHLHPSQNSAAQSQPTESIFNAAYPPVDSIFCDQL